MVHSPTRVLIVSDGRPGHFNLSEGIAAAIERLGPTTTDRIDVRRGRWSGSALAAATTGRLPARVMLRRVYGLDVQTIGRPDVIVSAGAETLAASIWLARHFGAESVHYGSVRLFDPQDFSLVLTSYQSQAHRPRHAVFLKPSRLDPVTLPAINTGSSDTLALLVGGDSADVTFTDSDWDDLVALVTHYGATCGARWLVANSRRTPFGVSERFMRLAGSDGGPVERFIDVRSTGPGTLGDVLSRAGAVIVTADSSSMLSEAIWARRPCVAVSPQRFLLGADEAAYRGWLEGRGWCRTRSIADLTAAGLRRDLAAIAPMTTNPHDVLSRLILAKLPRLRATVAVGRG